MIRAGKNSRLIQRAKINGDPIVYNKDEFIETLSTAKKGTRVLFIDNGKPRLAIKLRDPISTQRR